MTLTYVLQGSVAGRRDVNVRGLGDDGDKLDRLIGCNGKDGGFLQAHCR